MSEPVLTLLASPPESPTLEIEEAPAGLREAVDRARRRGESTLLTEDGRPVARVVPVESAVEEDPRPAEATASPDEELSPGEEPLPDGVLNTAGELARWWRTHERMPQEEADAFAADIEESRKIRNRPHVGFEWD